MRSRRLVIAGQKRPKFARSRQNDNFYRNDGKVVTMATPGAFAAILAATGHLDIAIILARRPWCPIDFERQAGRPRKRPKFCAGAISGRSRSNLSSGAAAMRYRRF